MKILILITVVVVVLVVSSNSRTDRWVHFQQKAGLRLYTPEIFIASMIEYSS